MIWRRIGVFSLLLASTVWAGQKPQKAKPSNGVSANLFPLTDPQQINLDISRMLAAWQLGDTDRLRNYYAGDVEVVSGTDQPPISGWKDYLAAVQEQHRRIQSGQLIRRNTYVQVYGDVAWASYQWEFGGLVDHRPADWRGHTTLIFERRNGAWLIVLNHTSLDAVPQPVPSGRSSTSGSSNLPRQQHN